MNKKYLVCSVLMMFLVVCKPSFSMGGKLLFKTARTFGILALPSLVLYAQDKDNKQIQKWSDAGPVSEVVDAWGKEKMKKLNIAHADSIVFGYADGWMSTDKAVYISRFDEFNLSDALVTRTRAIKEHDDLKKNRDTHKNFIAQYLFPRVEVLESSIIQEANEVIELCDRRIAQEAIVFKHELGHIMHKDSQNSPWIAGSIISGVEMVSFGATSCFNKICNRKLPKTLMQAILRSGCAVGAIVPKALIGFSGMGVYRRYCETQADIFACENAESRLELVEWVARIREREDLYGKQVSLFDTHPSDKSRREMAESYLAKWDAEHADKRSVAAIERS